MTSKFLPLALIATVMMAGASFAGTTAAVTAPATAAVAAPAKAAVKAVAKTTETKGVIKAIDAKAHTVTLEDGTVFHVQSHVKIADLKVGESVSVTSKTKGKMNIATAIVAA